MVNLTWEESCNYCHWVQNLATQFGKIFSVIIVLNNENIRLPTEAEWEYAARGGKSRMDNNYSGGNKLTSMGWFNKNSNRTMQVSIKKPNELNIFDMSGNVREWCYDNYDKDYFNYSSSVDPIGPKVGFPKVLKGGSWINNERSCRVYARYGSDPSDKNSTIGFRIVVAKIFI